MTIHFFYVFFSGKKNTLGAGMELRELPKASSSKFKKIVLCEPYTSCEGYIDSVFHCVAYCCCLFPLFCGTSGEGS